MATALEGCRWGRRACEAAGSAHEASPPALPPLSAQILTCSRFGDSCSMTMAAGDRGTSRSSQCVCPLRPRVVSQTQGPDFRGPACPTPRQSPGRSTPVGAPRPGGTHGGHSVWLGERADSSAKLDKSLGIKDFLVLSNGGGASHHQERGAGRTGPMACASWLAHRALGPGACTAPGRGAQATWDCSSPRQHLLHLSSPSLGLLGCRTDGASREAGRRGAGIQGPSPGPQPPSLWAWGSLPCLQSGGSEASLLAPRAQASTV